MPKFVTKTKSDEEIYYFNLYGPLRRVPAHLVTDISYEHTVDPIRTGFKKFIMLPDEQGKEEKVEIFLEGQVRSNQLYFLKQVTRESISRIVDKKKLFKDEDSETFYEFRRLNDESVCNTLHRSPLAKHGMGNHLMVTVSPNVNENVYRWDSLTGINSRFVSHAQFGDLYLSKVEYYTLMSSLANTNAQPSNHDVLPDSTQPNSNPLIDNSVAEVEQSDAIERPVSREEMYKQQAENYRKKCEREQQKKEGERPTQSVLKPTNLFFAPAPMLMSHQTVSYSEKNSEVVKNTSIEELEENAISTLSFFLRSKRKREERDDDKDMQPPTHKIKR